MSRAAYVICPSNSLVLSPLPCFLCLSRRPTVCEPNSDPKDFHCFMPTRPAHNPRKEAWNSKTSSNANLVPVQHGKQQQPVSILLDIPVESLTHVTSYLAPPALFALSRTCTRLYEHVKDDITWYRAFLTQVMGVRPEGHLDDGKAILLKRLEHTWREEFLMRYRLRRYACIPANGHE